MIYTTKILVHILNQSFVLNVNICRYKETTLLTLPVEKPGIKGVGISFKQT